MLPVNATCPKCSLPFTAAVKQSDDPVVLTPCCGWVGPGDPPVWAVAAIRRFDKRKAALAKLGSRYCMDPSNRARRLVVPREQAHADVRRTFDKLAPGWERGAEATPSLILVRDRERQKS